MSLVTIEDANKNEIVINPNFVVSIRDSEAAFFNDHKSCTEYGIQITMSSGLNIIVTRSAYIDVNYLKDRLNHWS